MLNNSILINFKVIGLEQTSQPQHHENENFTPHLFRILYNLSTFYMMNNGYIYIIYSLLTYRGTIPNMNINLPFIANESKEVGVEISQFGCQS